MPGERLKRNSGITLVEVTFAIAIFAVAIAMSAQAMMSFYATTDLQGQRISAMQANQAVIALIRQKRADYQEANDAFNWGNYITWIKAQQTAKWTPFLKTKAASGILPGHKITVTLLALDGSAAVAGNDPIEVHVRSTWTDLRGRTASAELVAAISER